MVHGLETVIRVGVRSMRCLKVYQGITLEGSLGRCREVDGKITGQPTFEDNVVSYTDAGVFDPVLIGKYNILKVHSITIEDISTCVRDEL